MDRHAKGRSSGNIDASAEEQERAALLNEAERIMARLADEYVDTLDNDVAQIEAALTMLDLDAETRSAGLELIARRAHDIKGQGGAFGYPLATRIAETTYRAARAAVAGETMDETLSRCAAALRQVVAGRLGGDGGDAGRAILAELRQAAGRDAA